MLREAPKWRCIHSGLWLLVAQPVRMTVHSRDESEKNPMKYDRGMLMQYTPVIRHYLLSILVPPSFAITWIHWTERRISPPEFRYVIQCVYCCMLVDTSCIGFEGNRSKRCSKNMLVWLSKPNSGISRLPRWSSLWLTLWDKPPTCNTHIS